MKANRLPKLKSWEAFEELCLRLWGAIWNKPEDIEFHSTNEQGQNGVDICCYLESEGGWVGIQCKNLKEETLDGKPNKLSIAKIKQEIQRAESFKPYLKKLILATSSEKDGKIQEAVRLIDQERREQGKFPVEIKFWDYIESRILQHPSIYNWYMMDQQFKTIQSVHVSFDNDLEEITAKPIFSQPGTVYVYKKTPNPLENFMKLQKAVTFGHIEKRYNRSFIGIRIKIKNTGDLPIEKWKIKISIDDTPLEISHTNVTQDPIVLAINPRHYESYDYSIHKTPPQIVLSRPLNTLVKNDSIVFDELFIKPNPIQGKSTLVLNWELLSKDYNTTGKLILNLETEFRRAYIEEVVDSSITSLPPIKKGKLKDYLSSEKKDRNYDEEEEEENQED